MSKVKKSAQAILHWIIANIIMWAIEASLLVLSWNYLIADWLGLYPMTIPAAIGILLIKKCITIRPYNDR